jgi:5-methylcytosine rRNA methyltransferase NSUN4
MYFPSEKTFSRDSLMNQFDEYFLKIYGDRWSALRKALGEKPKQGLFYNPFIESQPEFRVKEAAEIISPERDISGLLNVYILDPASVFVAKSLEAKEGDAILDMCAAPGGKSLVILSGLKHSGSLIANDLSDDRRGRMKKIFDQYLPANVRDRVHVKGWDAVQYGLKMLGTFDRVLLDAPCSGERHMLERPADMEEWKPKRAESLAQRQYALLCAALLAVKPGGTIIYSTCSLNPVENDGVIGKLLKKKTEDFELLKIDLPEGAEKTQFGLQFLPDVCGFGPMYCAKLRRVEA